MYICYDETGLDEKGPIYLLSQIINIDLPASALVFGMLHIYRSLYYILGAVAIAVVSGVLYHRQKNIWSSYALHFLLAFLPRCFVLK